MKEGSLLLQLPPKTSLDRSQNVKIKPKSNPVEWYFLFAYVIFPFI